MIKNKFTTKKCVCVTGKLWCCSNVKSQPHHPRAPVLPGSQASVVSTVDSSLKGGQHTGLVLQKMADCCGPKLGHQTLIILVVPRSGPRKSDCPTRTSKPWETPPGAELDPSDSCKQMGLKNVQNRIITARRQLQNSEFCLKLEIYKLIKELFRNNLRLSQETCRGEDWQRMKKENSNKSWRWLINENQVSDNEGQGHGDKDQTITVNCKAP